MPEDGWTSAAVAIEIEREFSPWWWATKDRTGHIHYVDALSASSWEEIVSRFLCGLTGENIWPVHELLAEDLCPACLSGAQERGLPLSL